MKRVLRLIAVVLVLTLPLSGCSWLWEKLLAPTPVAFADMEYERPDLRELEELVSQCEELAMGEDVEALMDAFYGFYDLYVGFYTAYSLSYIHYCIDMTDLYWEEEYNYCADRTATMDSAYDGLMYVLADSPVREELEAEEYFGPGFFDDYDGESLWTDEFTALMEKESQLRSEYYEITAAPDAEPYSEEFYEQCGQQLAELYVEIIGLRQQIAAEAGYDSYAEFAYEFYYGRDYTPRQAEEYIAEIRQELAPLYLDVDLEGYMEIIYEESGEKQTMDYVRDLAQSIGGTVQESFECMEELELYHISQGDNKPDMSFETYIYGYDSPFVFMNPYGTALDKLTLAHEFGHFCNDYASYGTMAGIDVAEIFSQGMEYLSLSYAEGGEKLVYAKLVDSLAVFVEQSAYASFEHQAYQLTGEELTVENVGELFLQVCHDYGWDDWGFTALDFVYVSHFFVNPMYVISYVVSNDAAMQLYQMEQAQPGSGLECYLEELDTEQAELLAFLQEAGLESPFAEGRVSSLRETFQKKLG